MHSEAEAIDEFTPEQWLHVTNEIERHAGQRGALIPVLESVQQITGYLPERIQRAVASGLGIPLSQVYGVVTFYSFFTMTPRGRHEIRLCLGTACHVRGAARNLDHLCGLLEIAPSQCTTDREFSLDIVRCIGACGLAPVMTVGDDIHQQVNTRTIDAVVARHRHEGSASQE